MKIHQIRNATIAVEKEKHRILVDPMLGRKGSLPPFSDVAVMASGSARRDIGEPILMTPDELIRFRPAGTTWRIKSLPTGLSINFASGNV